MGKNDMIIGELSGVVKRLEILADKMEARLTIVERERSEERGGRKMLMLLGAGVATAWGIVGSFVRDWIVS